MDSLDSTEIIGLTITANLLDEMERVYASLGESEKRRLTIPTIFKKEADENFLSDYLAYILDPEINGIGIDPIRALINLTDGTNIESNQAHILREYTFNNPNHGRIDLIIELGEDGIIGIENKLFSTENENQTSLYVRGLNTDFKGKKLYMIFLSPSGLLPNAREFKPVSYSDLAKSFRKIQYPVLTDIHKTIIWEDFIYHLEEYVVMNNGKLELSEKTQLYIEHHKMIDGLYGDFENDSQKIYDYVINQIVNKFGENWHFNFQGRNSYQEINNDTWRFKDFYLYYQYIFSRDDLLTTDSFSFMLGVYPKTNESNKFYEWLKMKKPEIINHCLKNNIKSYPVKVRGTGGYVIANNDYPLILERKNLTNFHDQFIKAIDDFKALNPIIDNAINEYKRINK